MSPLSSAAPSEQVSGMVANARHWFAVYTSSRHERSVKDHLDTKDVEVFLPTVVVESRWKDRNMQLRLPAFPGYVFVRIAAQERVKVLAAPGVVRILSFNGAPAPINHGEIEALRLCLDRRGPIEPHPFLEVGERVRVRSGALQGLEGLVARKKGACRLVLSIALIHQSVAVEIDAELLETLRPAAHTVTKASAAGATLLHVDHSVPQPAQN